MLLRLFHRILAKRLEVIPIGAEQVAYRRKVDGCAKNLFLLQSIIRVAHADNKPLFLCFVDVRKAFDSCSRGAILAAARRVGIPEPLVEYLEVLFNQSGVFIQDEYAKQNQGVRQGDPLSGALFNFIIDFVYSKLSANEGFTIDSESMAVFSHLLFADDGVIFSDSFEGLRHKVNAVVAAFREAGMQLNPAKSCVLALERTPRKKCLRVANASNFGGNSLQIDGVDVPFMAASGQYKYLGQMVGPSGFVKGYGMSLLKIKLERLTKSSLKPQGKLFVLRNQLLPSLNYILVLSEVYKGELERMDRMVRKAVRKFLHLPGDTPSASLHASVKDGGLGIPNLATTIPINRTRRLASIG